MISQNRYSTEFEDSSPEDYGLPQYVLDRLNVTAPPTTTIDFGQPVVSAPAVQNEVASPLSTTPVADTTQTTQVGGLPTTTSDTTATSNAGNVLTGNILAGASWNSINPTIADELTAATGQNTLNTAVGGATTADTLKQLNDFTASGGSFAPGSTVFLQTGGVDMLQGVDDATIKNNIDQIVSRLEDQGVNVVLTAAPRATSMSDVVNNNFETGPASFYSDIANNHSNVAVVDSMGRILQDKTLLADNLHPNATGWEQYNQSVIDTYNRLVNKGVDSNTALAIAKQTDTQGMSPEGGGTTQVQEAKIASSLPTTSAQNPLIDLYQKTLGRTPTQEEINSWNFGDTIDANELDRFLGAARNEATSALPTTGVASTLAQQILAQGTSSKWTGEGYGSPEKTAYDMGVMLAGQGITDINQLGQETKVIPGYSVETEQGTVDVPEQTVTQFINKATGQPINAYYDKAQGNTWGGTFAGEGSTAYKVQFDASGKPIFYSQYGGSSNDLANLMTDLGPLGQIGLAVATGGLSLPEQLAANFAVQVLSGKDIGDAIKNTAISYAGAQIPGLDAVKEGSAYLNTIDSTGTLAKAFQNAAVSGGKALLSGQDLGNAIVQGAVTGGTSGAVNTLMSNVEGFNDLTPAQKSMVTNAVTGVISGKPLDQIVINSAISAANNAVAQAKGVSLVGDGSST